MSLYQNVGSYGSPKMRDLYPLCVHGNSQVVTFLFVHTRRVLRVILVPHVRQQCQHAQHLHAVTQYFSRQPYCLDQDRGARRRVVARQSLSLLKRAVLGRSTGSKDSVAHYVLVQAGNRIIVPKRLICCTESCLDPVRA